MAVNSQKFLPQTGGGALATTRPTATLVPYKKPAGGALVKQPTPDDEGDTKPSLEEDVAAIRVTTKKIEKIIGKTLKLNKDTMRFEARTAQKDSRNEKENKGEKKKRKGIKMPKGIKVPKIGFLDRIKNFIGTILLGRLMVLLVDFAPKIAEFIKFISPIATFIGDVVSGLADKLTTAITLGYKVKDKVEDVSKNLFGDEGLKKFKEFQGHFTKFMNLAMIAVMIGATAANDAGVGKSRLGGKAGQDLKGRKTSTSAQQRYRRRFGDRKFADRFGRKNLNRLGKNVAKKSTAKLAKNAATGLGAKFAKTGAGKIIGKVPIVGPLIDFGVRAFILGEPLGKAAAGAVGMGVGQALGTFLGGAIGGIVGSVVPFVGNLLLGGAGSTIGGLIGGVIGDQIGVSLYNVIAGKEDAGAVEDAGLEAKAKGGVVGEEEYEDEMRKRARSARVHKIMPSRDDHMTTGTQAASATRGKRTGNVFNRLFSFMTDSAKTVTNFVNPFEKIKKAVKNLRKSNSGILSKIMALGADLIAGKKPDGKAIKDIIKSLVTFFDAAVPAPVNLLRGILQKLADGGYIIETPQQRKSKLRNLTTLVERKLLMDVTRDTTQALNVIKGIKGDEKKSPGNTAAASSSSSGSYGTGSMIPGTRLPSAGRTLGGSDKLVGLTGQSGSVKYDGQAGARLDISYSPFAQSDIQDQASRGGIVITSGKGYRASTNSDHRGYDVGADPGTPMYAYLDGEVTHANSQLGGPSDGGYGYWVVWKDDPHGAYHFFGHLDRPPALSPGTKFKAGALLANVGGSGFGSLTQYPPHLHWEISTSAPNANGQFTSYVDPGKWINTHGAQKNETQVATNAPKNNAADVSQQASYEETGTTVAVIENTEYVRVPVLNRRGNKTGAYRMVPKDKQVIKPA